MNNEGAMKNFMIMMVVVMAVSFAILTMWNSVPFIKDSVHGILDPSFGGMLRWNLTWGMMGIVAIISILMTLIQKYATDQEALRELKKEQKILQEEMKKYREHPSKLLELQKKQFEFLPRTFQLTSRSIMFTAIPFILLFRWFNDFFSLIEDARFFGFMTWFWFYLIFVMIFSTIFRKLMKVV